MNHSTRPFGCCDLRLWTSIALVDSPVVCFDILIGCHAGDGTGEFLVDALGPADHCLLRAVGYTSSTTLQNIIKNGITACLHFDTQGTQDLTPIMYRTYFRYIILHVHIVIYRFHRKEKDRSILIGQCIVNNSCGKYYILFSRYTTFFGVDWANGKEIDSVKRLEIGHCLYENCLFAVF